MLPKASRRINVAKKTRAARDQQTFAKNDAQERGGRKHPSSSSLRRQDPGSAARMHAFPALLPPAWSRGTRREGAAIKIIPSAARAAFLLPAWTLRQCRAISSCTLYEKALQDFSLPHHHSVGFFWHPVVAQRRPIEEEGNGRGFC